MKYRNTISGAIVDVSSKVSGNWELVIEPAPVVPTEEAKKVAPKRVSKRTSKNE